MIRSTHPGMGDGNMPCDGIVKNEHYSLSVAGFNLRTRVDDGVIIPPKFTDSWPPGFLDSDDSEPVLRGFLK